MTAAPKASIPQLAALSAILLAALLLRYHHLARPSLWMDEIMSLQIACGWPAADVERPADEIHSRGADMVGLGDARPLSDVFRAVAADTHPPLYFLLLRYWCELFGTGDGAVRLLSVVVSIFGIIALFDAARLWHGSTVALWSAALMAVATQQIIFAQEVRGYVLLQTLVLCQLAAIAQIQVIGQTPLRLIGLGLATFGALMTHYTAIPATLALIIYVLIELQGPPRWRTAGTMGLSLVVFLLAWGAIFWSQRQNLALYLQWTADDEPGHFMHTLARVAGLPIKLFISPTQSNAPTLWIGAVFYLAALLAWFRRKLRAWVFLAGAIIGATAAADLIQHHKAMEIARFTFAVSPALFAIVAVAGTYLRWRWLAHVVPAVFVLGCVIGLPQAYDPVWKPDARSLVRQLDAIAGPAELLIIPYVSREKDWYSPVLLATVTHYSAHPNRPVLALSKPASNEIRAAAARMPAAWMLGLGRDSAVDELLPGVRSLRGIGVPYVGGAVPLAFTSPASQPSPPPPAPNAP